MIEHFEEYFEDIDINDLKNFLNEAQAESKRLKATDTDVDDDRSIDFMSALIENIQDEIEGVFSLSDLEYKKKVRLYSLIHLLQTIVEDEFMDDEEFFDEDGLDETDFGDAEETEGDDNDRGPDNDRIYRL